MAVAGALIGGALGSFGRKPEIPKLPGIDPNQVQSATIAANKDALPNLEALGSAVNAYNQKEQLGMLSKALEFFAPGQLQKAQGIVDSQLGGEIPRDVALQVQRNSAAQALLGGFGGGSALGRNLTDRDLGLTSLQIQQQGLQGFGFLAGLAPRTQAFDVTSMFFTPQQRMQAAFAERDAQFQRNLMAEQVAAAPDPATAALGREIDRFFNTAAQFGMMAGGAAMGGGGGMIGGGGGASGGSVMGGWGYGGSNWLNNQINAGSANGATV